MKFLPPHDPDRFETIDGLCDPGQTNGKRADHAKKALAAFPQIGYTDDNQTAVVSDLICNLFHYAHGLGSDPTKILRSAMRSFYAEAGPLKIG